MNTNPEISQKFLEEIKNQSEEIVEVEGVKIKTVKGVFPPKSIFSHSSEKLYDIFGDVNEKDVLDVGTGTGIQAIHAAKQGARKVVALDINPTAVFCARENITRNNVEDRVEVIESDLFSNLPGDYKFDIVIANLPITDFPLEGIVELTLYDPGYRIHRGFFEHVKNCLKKDGTIVMTHINFKGENDFEEFEEMLIEYGFFPENYIEISDVNYREYKWRMYRIKKNQS